MESGAYPYGGAAYYGNPYAYSAPDVKYNFTADPSVSQVEWSNNYAASQYGYPTVQSGFGDQRQGKIDFSTDITPNATTFDYGHGNDNGQSSFRNPQPLMSLSSDDAFDSRSYGNESFNSRKNSFNFGSGDNKSSAFGRDESWRGSGKRGGARGGNDSFGNKGRNRGGGAFGGSPRGGRDQSQGQRENRGGGRGFQRGGRGGFQGQRSETVGSQGQRFGRGGSQGERGGRDGSQGQQGGKERFQGQRGGRGGSQGQRFRAGGSDGQRFGRGGSHGQSGGKSNYGGKRSYGGNNVDSKFSRNQEPATDFGIGISSLSDLISSARARQTLTDGAKPDQSLEEMLIAYKQFLISFKKCNEPISDLNNALRTSKIGFLSLEFEVVNLTKLETYEIFTSTLNATKKVYDTVYETAFLARGMGLSKKSAKSDCYAKAFKLLMSQSVEEIMSQEDLGKGPLIDEVNILYSQEPRGFIAMLKKNMAIEHSMKRGPPATGPSFDRQGSQGSDFGYQGAPPAKKPRPLFGQDFSSSKDTSLAPVKKTGILMKQTDPLSERLVKLKELLKEEGITKLHIVPKVDQFALKTAISIKNVFRYTEPPVVGIEHLLPMMCELYMDGILVAIGGADVKRNVAMLNTYMEFSSRLFSEPISVIISPQAPKWNIRMASSADVYQVTTKAHGQDNNSLFTSNLANMKQMMQSGPDVTIPIERLVYMEHEVDDAGINVFKSLELSATRNCMLLECEVMRNPDETFTCMMSLQGRRLCTRQAATKNGAKRICSEAVVKLFRQKHDFIRVGKEIVGRIVTKDDIVNLAKTKRALQEEPKPYFTKPETVPTDPEELAKRAEHIPTEDAVISEAEMKELAELKPWLINAFYEILDDHLQSIHMEDLRVDSRGMPKLLRDIVMNCSLNMDNRCVTLVRQDPKNWHIRRSQRASEILGVLQLNNNVSGRYSIVNLKHPMTVEEKEAFRTRWQTSVRELQERRDKGIASSKLKLTNVEDVIP